MLCKNRTQRNERKYVSQINSKTMSNLCILFLRINVFQHSLTNDQYIYSNFLSFFCREVAISGSYSFFLFRSCSSRSKKVRRLYDDGKSTFTIQRWSREILFSNSLRSIYTTENYIFQYFIQCSINSSHLLSELHNFTKFQ